ncbi:TetR family transcriptional regulator C-terminal domain-containing protein [Salipiger sp. P9]|uniref:TetR family transcriptional regulator C-terminal domain-containing protein n=1 Tax=Salipiger pentaromativorans TaxID=2943193 RepID=UPI0021575A61|nr:TetR family transcriptional regulator C-terminal domain-containing protein [Salipiger pentaromativorans]MCR8548339.1 TetR family transcriptional regulator C-terminal domain-containing protein [Salipiger pentaromativorans]
MTESTAKKPSRIQLRNRKRIMDAALDVFSQHGYRGATLDQIADAAGMSKPNLIYYFDGKEAIHVALLNALMEKWLAPLAEMGPEGEPLEEMLGYIRRKMEMSRAYPRESRLFANEILQGAPRMRPHLESRLKPLFDEKSALVRGWMDQGRLARSDPAQLILTIWAITQHYADFDAQVRVLVPGEAEGWTAANAHVEAMFRNLLTPKDTGS